MSAIIDLRKSELSYKNDLRTLESMLEMYNKTHNLTGAFYTDMVQEINLQIEHCKDCLKNIENSIL
jgi:hypothetical protein